MAAIPIGQGVYDRLDNVPLVLRNLVFEADPTNTEDQVSLYSRPGLQELLTAGTGAFRGLMRQDGAIGGLIFFVIGTTLYKSTQDGLTVTSVGTIAGSSRCVFAGNGSYILIATGTTLYSTDGATVSAVAFPDSADVVSVAILNNYFLAVRANSQRVYFSAVGGITFAALDYFSAETQPDNLVNIAVHGDELWMLGQSSVEVYVPSGDADAPFLRVNGRMFPMGCAGRDGVAKIDDGIAWVGQDRVVYHDASAPVRISTETVEQVLTENPDADLTAWGYTVEGRVTYVLNIGTVCTFAFCNGKWTKFNTTGYDYLPAWSSARLTNGGAIVGSLTANTIWYLDPTSAYDDETGMVCEFMGLTEIYGAPLRCDSVILDCSTGMGTPTYPTDNPTIQMAVSDDRGQTWQTWATTYLGREGVYSQQVNWAGALQTGGLMRRPGRVFWWRTVPPSRFVVRKARLNESLR